MKKIYAVVAAISSFLILSSPSLAAAEKVFKVAHVFNTDHPVHAGLVQGFRTRTS